MTWMKLTVSGPRFCPPRPASPEHPSTPQRGRLKVASGGYFWGSPGGWERAIGLLVLCDVPCLRFHLGFVPSQGAVCLAHHRWCPFIPASDESREPSLQHPWPLCDFLTSRESEAPSPGGCVLRGHWILACGFCHGTIKLPVVGKVLGEQNALLSVGIWGHRNRGVY